MTPLPAWLRLGLVLPLLGLNAFVLKQVQDYKALAGEFGLVQ